jgi:ABC-type oligopeptide transport system ATPase subunit
MNLQEIKRKVGEEWKAMRKAMIKQERKTFSSEEENVFYDVKHICFELNRVKEELFYSMMAYTLNKSVEIMKKRVFNVLENKDLITEEYLKKVLEFNEFLDAKKYLNDTDWRN